MSYQKRPAWWLVLHTLSPSGASLVGGLLLAVCLLGLHTLLLSQNPDLLLPHFTGTVNSQLEDIYGSAILAPMDRFFSNHVLSTVTTALVWGLVGWIIYAVTDFLVTRTRELRSSDREITMPDRNQVIRHPLHNQTVIRLLWRFLMGLLLLVVTILLKPVVAELFKQDVLFLQAGSALEMLKHAGISLLGWIAISHLYVMLLRLFVLRTRVFGELIY